MLETLGPATRREVVEALDWLGAYMGLWVSKADEKPKPAEKLFGKWAEGLKAAPKNLLWLETELARRLLSGWGERSLQALQRVVDLLSSFEGPVTAGEAELILAAARRSLGPEMSAAAGADVERFVSAAYLMSRRMTWASIGAGLEPAFTLVDERARAALAQQTIYWVGNHYDQELSDTVARIVLENAVERGLGRAEVGRMLKAALGERFERSDAYWKGLAAHAVTRARAFGQVRSYLDAGVTHYEIMAMGDERTCPICREMDVRIVSVSAAAGQMERLVAAEDPEQVKQIAPWPKPGDLRGKRTADIESLYGLPPFHFHCRCTTVSRMDDNQGPGSDGIIQTGETVELESENLKRGQAASLEGLSIYTRPELANKLNQARWATMDIRHARTHVGRHEEARGGSPEGYIKTALDVVMNPDDILVFRHGDTGTSQIAFGKRGDGTTDWLVAIVDLDAMRIKTLYGPREDRPATYDQGLLEGRRSQGWLEVRLRRGRDLDRPKG